VVEARNGVTIRRKFVLKPDPKFATLVIDGAQPNTEVLLDGELLGITDSSGAFTHVAVPPGDHQIELRNGPQFKPKVILRSFRISERTVLSAVESSLEPKPAAIVLRVAPPGALVEWRCGQGPAAQSIGNVAVKCLEPSFRVSARMEGYEAVDRSWNVLAGRSYELSIELKRIATPPSVERRRVFTSTDVARAGWQVRGEWYVAPRPLPVGGIAAPAEVEFTIKCSRGLLAKAVHWTILSSATTGLEFGLKKSVFFTRQPARGTTSPHRSLMMP
jgi:hypothetical protein